MKKIDLTAFKEFPYLTTRRLKLRPILASDAQALFGMQSDALIFKYIAKTPQNSIEQTEKMIAYIDGAYQKQEMLCWSATLSDSNTIIGTCGFNRFEKENLRAEIGGSLSPKYWGGGVALEAVYAILEYGFNGLKLHTIEAKIDSRNRSARYLLECLGFEKEAYFKERFLYEEAFYDLEVWTLFEQNLQKRTRHD